MDYRNVRAAGAILMALGTALGVTGCDSGGGSSDSSSNGTTNAGGTAGTGTGTGTTTGTGTSPGTPSGPVATRTFTTDVMVFTGNGTWASEISDAEALLTSHGASYQEVNDAQLDAMTPADIANFGTIFIPGGTGSTEAEGVSAATHSNLRTAVQSLGVSYVGFCAGAFVAVAPAPTTASGDVSYGFGVVNGAVENEYAGPGTTADYFSVVLTYTNGTTENILWYGGPITPNEGVLATYPTGDPAISQIQSGAGLVIIAGVHPDVSTSTLDALGVTPDTNAQDTAWKIFNAAITSTPLTSL